MFKRTLLIVLFFLSSTPFASSETTSQTINIGAILPLTGDSARWGEAIKNGMELALEKLSPDIRQRIHLLYEDDSRTPSKSVIAFQSLMATRNPIAIIAATAQPGMAIAPLADQAKVPFISISIPPAISRDRKYTVMFFALPEDMAKLMVDESLRRGYQHIARINSIHDGRMAMKENYDRFSQGRIAIVHEADYVTDERDFRGFLTQLKNKNIDAIHVNLVQGQAGLFARQARELKINVPLFCSEMFEDPSEIAISKGALVGQWFINQAPPPEDFEKEYAQRFPKSASFEAGNGFDLITLLAQALTNVHTRDELNNYLHNVKDFHGVLGHYHVRADNRFALPVAVREVTPDGFRTLRVVESSE